MDHLPKAPPAILVSNVNMLLKNKSFGGTLLFKKNKTR